MKTGLVGYKISEHGAGLGVVVKRARVSHVCDECTAPITPKMVYIEHPIRFGAPMKVHVKCAVKLELAEPLAYADTKGDTYQRFTPGEWEVRGDRDVDGLQVVQAKTGGVIATIEITTGYAVADRANAQLIAIAPRLYGAIRTLTTVVDPEREEIAVGFSPQDWTNAMRECREALTAATAGT
jgi:hypothetical protein